jgi:putative redox protein
MANAKIHWAGGHTFIGSDSTNHAVILSSAQENVGMKASELVLVALGTCSAYDVVSILKKQKITLTKLDVAVTAEHEPDPPWAFTSFHLKYTLSGDGLEPRHAEAAILLSQEKYCSVAATLRAKADITWEFVIDSESQI